MKLLTNLFPHGLHVYSMLTQSLEKERDKEIPCKICLASYNEMQTKFLHICSTHLLISSWPFELKIQTKIEKFKDIVVKYEGFSLQAQETKVSLQSSRNSEIHTQESSYLSLHKGRIQECK